MKETRYKRTFYEFEGSTSEESASHIVPLLIEYIDPNSVVDVGCGRANFLAEFMRLGIDDVLGIEGPWVSQELFKIPSNKIMIFDLSRDITIGRRFDLVISLEVAEHIDQSSATKYIENLTKLGNVVLFSAAIPSQGGTHHVNEQWPDYWANIFKSHNFTPVDALRSRLWQSKDVSYYYAQNCIFYVHKSFLPSYPSLKNTIPLNNGCPLPLVHPSQWISKTYYLRFIPNFIRESAFKIGKIVMTSGKSKGRN